MIEIDIQIDTKDTDAALRSLPDQLANKWLRKGVFEGAKIMRDRVKRSAPIRREGIKGKYYGKTLDQRLRYPGFLQKSIGAKYAAKRSSKTDVRYHVKPIGQAYYGFFVEGGHRIGRRPSKGKIRTGQGMRGQVPPHPFMEPVFRNAANDAIARMKTVIEQGAYREWAATGFKGWARQ